MVGVFDQIKKKIFFRLLCYLFLFFWIKKYFFFNFFFCFFARLDTKISVFRPDFVLRNALATPLNFLVVIFFIFMVWYRQCLEDSEQKDHRLNQ